MAKNKYVYKCPHCGKEVASLTAHYKKMHPENVKEALREGTRQRIKITGKSPLENMSKTRKNAAEVLVEEKSGEKSTETIKKMSKPMVNEEGDESGEKPKSFLDWIDEVL